MSKVFQMTAEERSRAIIFRIETFPRSAFNPTLVIPTDFIMRGHPINRDLFTKKDLKLFGVE